jgi:16S rRNA (uracil1498-N3)-methyltransferase
MAAPTGYGTERTDRSPSAMHRYRLYVPPDRIDADAARLDGEEFHYCTHVLRRRTGTIAVFDGVSREWEATLTAIERHHAVLHLDRLVRETASPPVQLVACPSLLKGKAFDDVVEQATELGADAITPVVTSRCDPNALRGDAEARRARWHRIAVAASRQCDRIALPRIDAPAPLDELLASLAGTRAVICTKHDEAAPLPAVLDKIVPRTGAIAVLVGPEADFTPEEIARAVEAGARPARLGPTTLRAGTATAYALSVVSAILGARRGRRAR